MDLGQSHGNLATHNTHSKDRAKANFSCPEEICFISRPHHLWLLMISMADNQPRRRSFDRWNAKTMGGTSISSQWSAIDSTAWMVPGSSGYLQFLTIYSLIVIYSFLLIFISDHLYLWIIICGAHHHGYMCRYLLMLAGPLWWQLTKTQNNQQQKGKCGHMISKTKIVFLHPTYILCKPFTWAAPHVYWFPAFTIFLHRCKQTRKVPLLAEI